MTTKYTKSQFIVHKITMKQVTFTVNNNTLISYTTATAAVWWIN